ncbi:unnamed protein product [Effrenium voratum]|uniref:Uncharacterized protein n=1 Tax=Effrenium voratum TaxID=2562239 RepID=A0AA36MJ00_9DINO|nr:unnamed protein product [Effrenium voratum]
MGSSSVPGSMLRSGPCAGLRALALARRHRAAGRWLRPGGGWEWPAVAAVVPTKGGDVFPADVRMRRVASGALQREPRGCSCPATASFSRLEDLSHSGAGSAGLRKDRGDAWRRYARMLRSSSREGQHSSALLASAATAGARREANAGVWPSRVAAQMARSTERGMALVGRTQIGSNAGQLRSSNTRWSPYPGGRRTEASRCGRYRRQRGWRQRRLFAYAEGPCVPGGHAGRPWRCSPESCSASSQGDALPRLRRLQRRVPDPRSLPELKSGAANFRTAEPAEPSRSSRLREVVSERSLANFLTRQDDRKAIETPGSGKPPRPVIETWKPLRVLCDPRAFHRRRHLCDRLLPGAAELLLGDYALIVQQHSLHRPPQFGAEEGRWKVESGGTCSPARTERRQRRNILFQLNLKLPLMPFKHSSAQRRDAPLPVALPVACRKPMVPMERRSFLCLQNLAMPPSTFVPKLNFGESRLQAKRPWLTCASRQAIETVSALALGGADEQLFAGAAPLALRVGFRALDAFGRKTEEEAEEGKAVRERDMLLFTGSQLQEVRDLYPFLQETDTEPAEGRPPEAAFQQLTSSRTVLAAGKRRFPLPKRRGPPPRGPAPRPAARPPRLRGPRQRGRPGGCKVLIVGGLGFRKRKDETVLKTVTMSGLENTVIQPLCAGERLGFPNRFASMMLMGGRYLDQMDFDDLVLLSLSFGGESVMKVAEHMERSSRPARGVVLWDWMSPAPTIHAGYNRFDEQILRAAQEDPRRTDFLHLWNMAESCSLRLKSAFFLHAVQVENEEQVDFIEEECAQRSALAIRFQDLRSAHLDEETTRPTYQGAGISPAPF